MIRCDARAACAGVRCLGVRQRPRAGREGSWLCGARDSAAECARRPQGACSLRGGIAAALQGCLPGPLCVSREAMTDSCARSFWSHDGCEEDEGGYMRPAGPGSNYADQQRVIDEFGNDVLHNALRGYNSCLFAYGQTGAGKSYSMVGGGANRGIIPAVCKELFSMAEKEEQANGRIKCQVMVSILELYKGTPRARFLSFSRRPAHAPPLTRLFPKSKCRTCWPRSACRAGSRCASTQRRACT